MKLAGPDGVIAHYLMDVDNRLGDLTVVSYTQRLQVLAQLLHNLCGVDDLEAVTVHHLRQCMQYLLSHTVSEKGRRPTLGSHLSASSVDTYVRIWKAFFNWCFQ